MSTINDGGPAFPVPDNAVAGLRPGPFGAPGSPGMRLRDYFAAHSFAAELQIQGDVVNIHQAAVFAYQCADALLAAREQVQK